MSYSLRKEIENLKKGLLLISAHVEVSLQKAINVMKARDLELAEEIIISDEEIDRLEVELEEECLKVLALHQPVAIDLRFIIVILKINNDLERIGDMAVNIAERAMDMSDRRPVEIPPLLYRMTETVTSMLTKSLNSLVSLDSGLAYEVWQTDDVVDDNHREMFQLIQRRITEHPDRLETLINLLSISRNLERIADLTTNIAEDVIYLLEGKVVRHRIDLQAPSNDE